MLKQTQVETSVGVVTLTQLPSMEVMMMYPRLGKLVGGALGEVLIGVGEVEGGILEADTQKLLPAVGKAIPKLFENLTPEEFRALIRDFCKGGTIIGETKQPQKLLEQLDSLEPEEIFEVFMEAMKLNLGKSLRAVVEKLARLQALAKSNRATSPKMSVVAGQPGA